ncbi:MAG: 50S ribosome-binding GTPase [Planctomycetota bacterium]|nr:50S ribosome-binding GTPase [Planctomycetaceae bacterium]MDQ3332118.1 50S ribosome-binding GTPase [Planctomycetota bacterium]
MTRSATNIAAVLTARGRGAVATVAFRGDVGRIDAAGVFRAANGKRLVQQPLNRIAFGRWGDDPEEEVVVCRIAADRLEIHCHGGDAAVARVLALLADAGVEQLDWREFLAETEDRFAADAATALATAATSRTAAVVARQIDGPLRDLFSWLATIDPVTHRDDVLSTVERALAWSEFGRHLTQPWRVVLYGEPNVGKSSLVNALVGFERAIVFDRPGTTRDVVTAESAIDGWPIRFSDTAGIRAGAEEIEAAGIERAKAELASADLCIRVFDASVDTEDERFEDPPGQTPLIVFNKCDLPPATRHQRHEGLAVSARTGAGLRELMSAIVRRLLPRVPAADEAVPITGRQIDVLHAARSALIEDDRESLAEALNRLRPLTKTPLR